MKILLLAGTAEARALAKRLDTSKHQVVASLAGLTKTPKPLGVPTRFGGFGGRQAQQGYIRDEGFDVIVDATHPFANVIPHRSHQICHDLALPYLRLSRPEWTPKSGENWHHVQDAAHLGQVIPKGANVFLATGGQSQDEAAALDGRTVHCRRVDNGPSPFAISGRWITARPPFSEAEESALFQELGVDWIVAKNAGGPTRAKLDAAHVLGVSVAMIARPQGPDAPTVETIEDAMKWVEALCDG